MSFLAQAQLPQDQSFNSILDYYKNHIGEDEEVFLELRTYEDGKSETNYIVGSLIQEPYYNGLYSIEMTHLLEEAGEEDETIDMILDRLFDNEDTFFCDTLKNIDADCKQVVQGLIEELLLFSSDVTITDIKGNLYGDWRTIIITASDWRNFRTVALEFDIIHEI